MSRVLLAVAVFVVVGGAIAGVLVWTVGGSSDSCDESALIEVMAEGIAEAERNDAIQHHIDLPEGCTDDDMVAAMPSVSRDWHVMPGGDMMRESEHTE